MTYNVTEMATNTTGILTFVQNVNDTLMFGWFGIMLLAAITIIMFMAFMVTIGEIKRAAIATMFLSFIFSIFLKMMSLVPNSVMFITLILLAVSIAFSFMGKDD